MFHFIKDPGNVVVNVWGGVGEVVWNISRKRK